MPKKKKPYLYFRCEPWLVYPWSDIYSWLYHEPAELAQKLEEQRIAVKNAIAYGWDNSNFYVTSSLYHKHFQFSLYIDRGHCSLAIYDLHSQSIFSGGGAIDSDEWYQTLELASQSLKDAEKGYYTCHGCNDLIKENEIAGRYFASVFCDVCWDTKWRAIEAKETYN